jgi:quinolinate synthase
MNSAANLKAFCGRNGGAVCTSSNATKVLEWGLAHGQRLLFFPDEHLGRNTADKLGIPQERCIVWKPRQALGGNTPEQVRQAVVILWRGFCSVHARFNTQQIAQARAEYPDITVLVHPECRREVVQASDLDGSTEFIIKAVEAAPAGSQWAIGTEINLVRRLANEHPDKTIFCLDPVICPCSTMYRIHPAYLAWVLEALVDGQVLNRVTVDAETANDARVALDRMLALK